ncbi:MAG: DUF4142 domain-containing protein [Acidobacteriaceae bacterium]|nr:DUF4142 domain-containing protein [Acidobacteriaceae bacterium]
MREFAQRMVTDHSAVKKSLIALAEKLHVTAEDSSTSEGLKKGAAEITVKLKSLKGKESDKFYIGNEVSYHKAVTDVVQGVLIPNAQNPSKLHGSSGKIEHDGSDHLQMEKALSGRAHGWAYAGCHSGKKPTVITPQPQARVLAATRRKPKACGHIV